MHEIIFEADTRAGKAFDVLLILSIVISVTAVMLESIKSIRDPYGHILYTVEWFFTILFTIEYLLRIFTIGRPWKYIASFYGIVDLFAILPTYFDILLPGSRVFLVIRILRLLRIFRVFKLVQYLSQANLIMDALQASRRKITVFLFTVFMLVIIFGSLMYVIEGEEHGFTSIPVSIYWAVVTLTTVGYGDLSPQTGIGQLLAALIMIMGYGIIAVPTGIVTVEMANQSRKKITTQSCPSCGAEGHDRDAIHCKYCGSDLEKF